MTSSIAVIAAVACLVSMAHARPVSAQTTTPRAPSQAPRIDTAPPAPPWQVQLGAGGVFDTNVDHDRDDLDAYGGLLSGRVRYRTGPLTLDYRLGVNRFTEPTRWNRITNRGAARLTHALDPAWTVDLRGEISFQQRSEDQELGNFYVVSPSLEYHAERTAVRGFMLYRLKQIQEDVDDNVTNWYFGAEVEQEAGDATWLLEYRRELNLAVDPRRTYAGHRFTIEYERELTPRDDLRVGLTFRPQSYRERLVPTDDGPELRHDRRWLPEVLWLRALSPELTSRVEYSWERRLSNEVAREFSAHRFGFTMVWSGVF